jgi:hypothetical protein
MKYRIRPYFGTFLVSLLCQTILLFVLGHRAYNNALELILMAFIAGALFGQSFSVIKVEKE